MAETVYTGSEGEDAVAAAAASVEATPAAMLAGAARGGGGGCGFEFNVGVAADGIDPGGEEVEEGAAEEGASDEGADEGVDEEKS